MNGRKAKLLRRAAALDGQATQYRDIKTKVRLFERATPAGVELAQCVVVQPIRLAGGSARRVYQTLKHMEKHVGLDTVFREMQGEANADVTSAAGRAAGI